MPVKARVPTVRMSEALRAPGEKCETPGRREDTAAEQPRFFATPADFRAWLEAHHETKKELLVGFRKKATGKPSITWPESVDEALCVGWIDGVRRRVDESAYTIRFTPRRPKSIWSAVNVARVAALTKLGRMKPAGLRAFAARTLDRTGIYSFERKEAAKLTTAQEEVLRANRKAAAFFEAQPPGYKRLALHWVVSAKREETRERRLQQLIADSEAGRRIGPLTRPGK
ncbi:MAG: YdeI/OmpD-associated family protein [Acidobacteriota bacterium]